MQRKEHSHKMHNNGKRVPSFITTMEGGGERGAWPLYLEVHLCIELGFDLA